jgi:hypothetical protein
MREIYMFAKLFHGTCFSKNTVIASNYVSQKKIKYKNNPAVTSLLIEVRGTNKIKI